MDKVQMNAVKSSNISELGYDQEKSVAYVMFVNGNTYLYEGVSKETFDSMVAAPSVGAFFNANVRRSYKFVKAA